MHIHCTEFNLQAFHHIKLHIKVLISYLQVLIQMHWSIYSYEVNYFFRKVDAGIRGHHYFIRWNSMWGPLGDWKRGSSYQVTHTSINILLYKYFNMLFSKYLYIWRLTRGQIHELRKEHHIISGDYSATLIYYSCKTKGGQDCGDSYNYSLIKWMLSIYWVAWRQIWSIYVPHEIYIHGFVRTWNIGGIPNPINYIYSWSSPFLNNQWFYSSQLPNPINYMYSWSSPLFNIINDCILPNCHIQLIISTREARLFLIYSQWFYSSQLPDWSSK
jgi:hypothetical protein